MYVVDPRNAYSLAIAEQNRVSASARSAELQARLKAQNEAATIRAAEAEEKARAEAEAKARAELERQKMIALDREIQARNAEREAQIQRQDEIARQAIRERETQLQKENMGFLGIDLKSVVSKIAPKIVSATVSGGSQASQDALKTVLNSAVAKPVFDKFGSDLETGLKVTTAIATAGGLSLAGAGKTTTTKTGGNLVSNFLPTGSKAGDLLNKGFDAIKNAILKSSKQPGAGTTTAGGGGVNPPGDRKYFLFIFAAILVYLFRKQFKKLFR